MLWYFWVPWLMRAVFVNKKYRCFIINECVRDPGCARRMRRQFRWLFLWLVACGAMSISGWFAFSDTSWPVRVVATGLSPLLYGLVVRYYFKSSAERHMFPR